ncbi:hypothetical protein ACPPVO_34115 [Dactylosporangium sp. McL0621]|uniref:hypothetical protein n=1 Tax=Dactylosporangium sp. McL0621 TaxID=3415678 RepID=UPI003CE94289
MIPSPGEQPGESALWSMTELHEALHHDLQWSSGWGLLSSGVGIAARSGYRRLAFRELFLRMVDLSRETHETYATTISATIGGIGDARALLAGNAEYLAYLDRGLALADASGDWPWQFRIAAIDAVLRVCMRPAVSMDLLRRGFRQLNIGDFEPGRDGPDRRLTAFEQAGGPASWPALFERLLAEFPDRGGDTGAAVPPADSPDFDRLRRFEEEILGPRCHAHAGAVLERAGLASVGTRQQSALATAFRSAIIEVSPEVAPLVTLVNERRPAFEETLELHRQRVWLRPPLTAEVVPSAHLRDTGAFRSLDGEGGHYVCGLWLDRAVAAGQFDLGDRAVPDPLVAVAAVDGARIRLGLLPPDTTPAECQAALPGSPLLVLTTHHSLARHATVLATLQTVEPVFVLMDLPVDRHVRQWVSSGILVRLATWDVGGLTVLMLAVTRNHPFRFLCIGTPGGMYVLADQLRRRYPGQVVTEPALLDEHPVATRRAVRFALDAWHLLKQGGPGA